MTISRQIRTARKEYRCDCGHWIRRGEKHARLYGMAAEGDPPYALRVCMACDERAEKTRKPRRTIAEAEVREPQRPRGSA